MRIVAALPVRQRLGLRQQVGQQRGMVLRMRVIGLQHADEIGRHHLRALVQRLEKTVLGVGAGAAPPDRYGVDVDCIAGQHHRLAEALHHQLLKIGRQQLEPIVVRKHRLGGGTQRIAIPHRGQRMPDRDVLARRSVCRVRVHRCSAVKQLEETIHADRQRNREADRGPQGIATAYPIPHRQGTFRRHTEGGHALGIGADRVHALVVAQPRANDAAVEQGFLGAEGLGNDDRGGARRIQPGQHALHGIAIHVGDEMHLETGTRQGQRIRHQAGSEVGTTNADADDIGDVGRFERLDQFAHACLCGHGLHTCVDGDLRCRGIATQCAVQCRAAFGGIDDGAIQQAAHRTRKVSLIGDGEQGVERRAVVTLAREVGVQGAAARGKIAGAFRVGLDQFGDGGAGESSCVRVEPGQHAHAACFGIERLVWVRRFSRST